MAIHKSKLISAYKSKQTISKINQTIALFPVTQRDKESSEENCNKVGVYGFVQ